MNIYILPSKNKNNIYIELLASYLKRADSCLNVCRIKDDNPLSVFFDIVSRRKSHEKNIVHIQWSTILYGSAFALKSLVSLVINTVVAIILKIFYKTRFVWTVHNFYAHDYNHPIIDRIGRASVLFVSNAIVTQQEKTFRDYKNRYPNKNIQYIPHGNYIDAYGPIIERDHKLRESFGFDRNDIVLISLGAIKRYKLNEKIIESVIKARRHNLKIKLLIVGKGENDYVDFLKDMVKGNNGVVVTNYFVKNEDIPKYLSIADYSIFYYDQSEMTSGGIILSLSYGVPVISRNIPGAEMITGKSGLIFNDDDQLGEILSNIKLLDKSYNSKDDIIESVRNNSWDRVASNLLEIYKNI